MDHHKSRYVPAVLQSRYMSDMLKRDQSVSSRINTVRLEDEDIEQDLSVDENTGTKELVQKLYEIIYVKMADSYRAKQLYNIGNRECESVNAAEKKDSKTLNQRGRASRSFKNSSSQNNVKSEAKTEQEELARSLSSKSIAEHHVHFERNILNMEKNRKTPKLMAIPPTYPVDQNTKEAVHSMLNLYVASQSFCYGGEQSLAFGGNESGWDRNVSPYETGSKSKVSSAVNKEKSTLSEKSRKKSLVSNSSRVHFN